MRDAVTAALARVSALPGIASVASPYTAAGAAQVSRGGTVAFARVTWDKQPDQITAADADALISAAQTADGPGVHVSLGGASITNSERAKPGPSVAVGVIAALVILLIVFGGAFLAALTPLAGAALGAGHRVLGDHAAQPRADRRERLDRPRRPDRPGSRRRLRALHRQQAPGRRPGRPLLRRRRRRGREHVRAHRAVRGPDRVRRAARPVRARRQLPRRPVRRGRRHRRADHRRPP